MPSPEVCLHITSTFFTIDQGWSRRRSGSWLAEGEGSFRDGNDSGKNSLHGSFLATLLVFRELTGGRSLGSALFFLLSNVGADKDSDKRQRATIEAFAKRAGYAVADEYYDRAVSGPDRIDQRPGFREMLQRLASNGAKMIIVESPDRFARDLAVQLAAQVSGFLRISSSQHGSFRFCQAQHFFKIVGGAHHPTRSTIRIVHDADLHTAGQEFSALCHNPALIPEAPRPLTLGEPLILCAS